MSAQLTVSRLITLLQALQNERGDLPIVLHDADTNWLFKVKEEHFDVLDHGVLEIRCGYHDELSEDPL